MSTTPPLTRVQLIEIVHRLPARYRPRGFVRLHADELRAIVERAQHDPKIGQWLAKELKRLERERRGTVMA